MPAKTRTLQRLAEAALLALALGAAARASAQDIDKEPSRPTIERNRQNQEVRASGESQTLYLPPGHDVSYEQVLANPDDADLNYRYARGQVRKGDLKGAAATLERMLMVNPNQPRVRLFYAVVLYRLDNVVEAERELDILAKLKLPDPLGSEVDQYRVLVAKRRQKNRLSARVGMGFQYDTNRNAAPADGERLFLDTPVSLTGTSLRRDDTSLLFLGSLDYRRTLPRGHEAFTSLNYYRAEQTLVKTLNLQAYSLQGGATLRRGRDTLTPAINFDHVLLAQSTYLRAWGADLRYERKVGKRGSLFAEVRDSYQDFQKTVIVPVADERDGVQVDFSGGGDYVLTPTMKIGGSYTHTIKHAREHYNAFERDAFGANHIWLLGKGTFLLSNATISYDRYDEADRAISRNYRRDFTARASATYGAPLTLVHKSLKDLLMTFTYEYYNAQSTIRNYAYSNNKLATMITYKWDLGF